jgi:N utilization substance protein B
MTTASNLRRCALQALYQFDAHRGETLDDAFLDTVRASLEQSAGGESAHREGFDLAMRAWRLHADADAAVAERSPEWPTHRQPAIDRNILRLAYCELVEETTPPKVVINEAVELAREFSTERSPFFVNAVLDKIYKSERGERGEAEDGADADGDGVTPAPSGTRE